MEGGPREADILRVDLDRLSGILGCAKDELLRSLRRERVSTTQGVALAEEDEDKDFNLDNESVLYTPPRVRQALVTAVSRHGRGSAESGEGPTQLLALGGGKGKRVIDLVLSNLLRAGIERAVIVVGKHGRQIMQAIRSSPVKVKMEVAFVDLGEDYMESHAKSVVYARGAFKEPFLLVTSEHLFHPGLIHALADTHLEGGDAACVLVEEDIDPEQLSFLPKTANFVHRTPAVSSRTLPQESKVDPEEGSQPLQTLSEGRVVAIGRREQGLEHSWDGLDCGMLLLTPEVFKALARLARRRSHFTLADALDIYAGEGRLRSISTNGMPWLDLETATNRENLKDDLVERLTKEMEILPWASRTVKPPGADELDAILPATRKTKEDVTTPPVSTPSPSHADDESDPAAGATSPRKPPTALGRFLADPLPPPPRRWRPHAERHVRTGSDPGPGDDASVNIMPTWGIAGAGAGTEAGAGTGAGTGAGGTRSPLNPVLTGVLNGTSGAGLKAGGSSGSGRGGDEALAAGWRLADEWREGRLRTRSLQSQPGGSGKAAKSPGSTNSNRGGGGGGSYAWGWSNWWHRTAGGSGALGGDREVVGTRMGWGGLEPQRSLVLAVPRGGREGSTSERVVTFAVPGDAEEVEQSVAVPGESRWNFVPVMAEEDGGEHSGLVRGKRGKGPAALEELVHSGYFYPVESQDIEPGAAGANDAAAIIIPWEDLGDSRWADDEGYIVPMPGGTNQAHELMFAVPEPEVVDERYDDTRCPTCLEDGSRCMPSCMPELNLPTEMPTDIRSVRLATGVTEGMKDGEEVVAVHVVVDRRVPILGWLIMFFALLGASAMAPMGQLVQDLSPGMVPAFSPVWRWTCSAIMYAPFLAMRLRSKSTRSELWDWRCMGPSIKAGVANAGWGLCFYSALNFASAAMVALFASLTPLALVIWRGITGEAVHPMEMFGVGLALMGGVISTMGGGSGADGGFDEGAEGQDSSSQIIGVTLATITACWGGVYIVNAKTVRPNIDVILFGFVTTFVPALFCALVMIVALGGSSEGRELLGSDAGLLGWTSSSKLAWAQIATSLLSDIVGNLGFYLLLKYVSPLVISLVCLANPIVATIECLMFGVGGFPSVYFIAGGFLIVAGAGAVVAVSMAPRSEVFNATSAIKMAKGGTEKDGSMGGPFSPVLDERGMAYQEYDEFDTMLDPTPLSKQEHHESAPLLGSAGRVYYGAPSAVS